MPAPESRLSRSENLRLGLSLTATKSRVRRGRQMLKDKLQACGRFEFDRYGNVIDYERRHKCAC